MTPLSRKDEFWFPRISVASFDSNSTNVEIQEWDKRAMEQIAQQCVAQPFTATILMLCFVMLFFLTVRKVPKTLNDAKRLVTFVTTKMARLRLRHRQDAER